MVFRLSLSGPFREFLSAFVAAVGRLDKSLSPADTVTRLRAHKFVPSDAIYIVHLIFASFWLVIMQVPSFPSKLLIPILFAIGLFVPFTSQFFFPAIPVFAWLLAFYTNRFIPTDYRPSVHVVLLPTLETVLYGANISDILTRFTHPILDVIAWVPYGVVHYTFPIILALLLWIYRPALAVKTWAKTLGYMNLTGVLIQIILPCAAPWYELIYGLTPAQYGIPGSPGGLARIDALFGGDGYERAFGNSPLVFGAFPSLHAAWATLGALFVSHFWPAAGRAAWIYVGVLYWSTMYLTHHYLIDVVGGACLATAFFYLFMPDELQGQARWGSSDPGSARSKYEQYDLESRHHGGLMGIDEFTTGSELSEDDEEDNIMYRSPNPGPGPQPLSSSSHAPSKKPSVQNGRTSNGRAHRHTASIAGLIRADERSEGWSPIGNKGFVFPPISG
ncbi:hypothetical protein ID866_4515 [Astraeus odoratus]|nr:hypothetical protein ID866_4515 [Astraeus odoratus]